MRLQAKFGPGLEYNNRNECHLNCPVPARLGKRFVRKLRLRCSTPNPPIQPAHVPSLPDSIFMGRLFDSAYLPKLWKDAKPADVAGPDHRSHFFRIFLVVPVKSTWYTPWHDRSHLFWDHYCDRP